MESFFFLWKFVIFITLNYFHVYETLFKRLKINLNYEGLKRKNVC